MVARTLFLRCERRVRTPSTDGGWRSLRHWPGDGGWTATAAAAASGPTLARATAGHASQRRDLRVQARLRLRVVSKRRRPARAGHRRDRVRDIFVARPFEGLASEGDWVALRELVPAATAVVRLAPELAERHPGREIL